MTEFIGPILSIAAILISAGGVFQTVKDTKARIDALERRINSEFTLQRDHDNLTRRVEHLDQQLTEIKTLIIGMDYGLKILLKRGDLNV